MLEHPARHLCRARDQQNGSCARGCTVPVLQRRPGLTLFGMADQAAMADSDADGWIQSRLFRSLVANGRSQGKLDSERARLLTHWIASLAERPSSLRSSPQSHHTTTNRLHRPPRHLPRGSGWPSPLLHMNRKGKEELGSHSTR